MKPTKVFTYITPNKQKVKEKQIKLTTSLKLYQIPQRTKAKRPNPNLTISMRKRTTECKIHKCRNM